MDYAETGVLVVQQREEGRHQYLPFAKLEAAVLAGSCTGSVAVVVQDSAGTWVVVEQAVLAGRAQRRD
jgi:hypothetical protein